jgi:carbon-monoxide dehydrogenase medium subunit
MMDNGLIRPGHIVGLRGITALRGIEQGTNGRLTLRALATHRDAERSPLVRSHCPALAEAFARVATVRIRNQATVGGNLAHADPAQDPPPMLLALDGEVDIVSLSGRRTVPLDGSFFRGMFETVVADGELLTAIHVPPLPDGARATYVKFLPRTVDDYATVAVAAVLARDDDGRCTHVRIALGAAGPVAFRAHAAERALAGRPVDERAIADAADLAAEASDPIADLRGSVAYKRQMVRVWTARALRSLTPRAAVA